MSKIENENIRRKNNLKWDAKRESNINEIGSEKIRIVTKAPKVTNTNEDYEVESISTKSYSNF